MLASLALLHHRYTRKKKVYSLLPPIPPCCAHKGTVLASFALLYIRCTRIQKSARLGRIFIAWATFARQNVKELVWLLFHYFLVTLAAFVSG